MTRQLALQEVLRALGVQGAFIQAHAGQSVTAARDVQAVIAGGDGIALAPLLDEHAVICKGGLGGLEHAADAGKGKVLAGALGIVFEGDVRHRKLHLLSEFQQEASGNAVLRADVGMDKGVGLHPVDVPQEEAQHLLGVGTVFLDHKGLQQLVQIPQIHGEGRDGGHVAVEDLQHVHRLEQIPGRVKRQKLAALLKQQLVVRADITGTIGHDALVQVAQRALSLGLIVGVGIAQGIVGALAEAGQRQQLLLIGEGRVLNDFQCF